jgi:hypothetical protein
MSGRLPNTFKTLNPLIATLNPLITTFYSAWYHQVECAFWFNIALYIALLLAAEDKSVSMCSRVFSTSPQAQDTFNLFDPTRAWIFGKTDVRKP